MPFMAELDGLLARNLSLGDPRRAVDGRQQPQESARHEQGSKNADSGNRVRAAMKDLRHAFGMSAQQLSGQNVPY
jgi:hypothetical protein